MQTPEEIAAFMDRYGDTVIPTTIHPRETLPIVETQDAWVWLAGRPEPLLDACAQVSVLALGHNHRKYWTWRAEFAKAVADGHAVGFVMANDFPYQNIVKIGGKEMELSLPTLTEKIGAITFGKDDTVVLLQERGAAMVDATIRYYRTTTGKPYWIAFERAFHGRLGLALASSDSNTVHWEDIGRHPHCLRLPYPVTKHDVDTIEHQHLRSIPLQHCMGFVAEPILGEGGGMIPGKELPALARLLRSNGIRYCIVDEIQTGMGRCQASDGDWFYSLSLRSQTATEDIPLNPDAIIMAKALGGSFPVGATAFKKSTLPKNALEPGKISGTYPGAPEAVAAMLFVIRIYEEEGILQQAAEHAKYFSAALTEALAPFRARGVDWSGAGLFYGIRIRDDNGAPDPGKAEELVRRLRALRVLTITAALGTVVRISPPLVMTPAETDFLMRAIHTAISTMF